MKGPPRDANTENALALLRMALDRGWKLGTLFVVVCGGTLAFHHFGFKQPPAVEEWSTTGLLFGIAAIVLSVAVHLVASIQQAFERRAQKRVEAAEQEHENQSVIANLSALTVGDQIPALRRILLGPKRFQVAPYSQQARLLRMGLLKCVHAADEVFICEVHPALATRRDEVIRALNAP